jgi:hypothetical protein
VGRGKRLNCVVFGGFAAKNNAKRNSPLSQRERRAEGAEQFPLFHYWAGSAIMAHMF